MIIQTAATLTAPGIVHGFFGRSGGVSEGLFASLNCGPGSGDELDRVAENRRRVERALGKAQLVNAYQVHSAKALTVEAPWALGQGPQGDGMATATPGVALGVLTADCAPVLLADPVANVIGAAHAGWKGALSGVIEATIVQMERLGAARPRIAAAIGPCIAQDNYEVGPEFFAAFLAEDAARFFVPSDRPGHRRFDLEGFAAHRLAAAGVGRIECLTTCTYPQEAGYFSFRRATHRAETAYGRQVSAIALL